MIEAAVRGKMAVSEDVLTSTVLGMLSYLPAKDGFLPWLRRVRCFPAGSAAMKVPADGEVRVYFWPATLGHGIPDALLIIRDPSGKAICVIVVEAKFGSPKSQGKADNDDDDDQADAEAEAEEAELKRRIKDQLARYWSALADDAFKIQLPRGSAVQKMVLFLTEHPSPPFVAIEESLAASGDPAIRLGWVSWRDVWAALHDALDPKAQDLVRLLGRLGLTALRGFGGLGREDVVTEKGWFFAIRQDRDVVPSTWPRGLGLCPATWVFAKGLAGAGHVARPRFTGFGAAGCGGRVTPPTWQFLEAER